MNTLRVAKPEKGQKIEAMLIQMAQTGQLGGRIGEDELIGLLGKISIWIYLTLFVPKDAGASTIYLIFISKSVPFNIPEKISGTSSKPKVNFDRRRAALDSDSD